jgi:hypothetical protein
MLLRLALIGLLLLLAGCATYETRYVYEDGYYADGYAVRDGSSYAPARGAYGDYYVGQPSYRYVDSGYGYPAYLDWPAYYSVFWGFNRWYYDPFFYPGYYYGITYFPRHYHYGLSFGWSNYRYSAAYRYAPYSPYRYAWHDHYYDWSWWHARYPSHRDRHERPRYGSARNEAERLAWQSRAAARSQQEWPLARQGLREDSRRADYRSRPGEHIDPRIGAFGSGEGTRRQDARVHSESGRSTRPAWREDVDPRAHDPRTRQGGERYRTRQETLPERNPREDVVRRDWQPGSVQRAAPAVQTPPRARPEQRREEMVGRLPQQDRQPTASRHRGEGWSEPLPARSAYPERGPAPVARESVYRERPMTPAPRASDTYAAPRPERSWSSEMAPPRQASRPEAAASGYRPAPRVEQPAYRPEPAPRIERETRSEAPSPSRSSEAPARSEARRGGRERREWEP